MRKYDAIFIYQTGEDNVKAGNELVTTEFKNTGINVVNEKDMGERRLAYDIKKYDRGHYFHFDIEANPEALVPFEKSIKLKPEILKYGFFRKKK